MFKKSEPEPVVGESHGHEPGFTPDRSAPAGRAKESATIGPSIRIRGDLAGEEDLLVQGEVEGTITLEQNLVTIGKEGKVNATVNARVIIVEGQVDGDLNGEEQVTLKKSAGVRGNIVSPRVSLEDGARFKGSIDMEGEKARKPGADPKPDTAAAKVADFKSATAPDEHAPASAKSKPNEQPLFKS